MMSYTLLHLSDTKVSLSEKFPVLHVLLSLYCVVCCFFFCWFVGLFFPSLLLKQAEALVEHWVNSLMLQCQLCSAPHPMRQINFKIRLCPLLWFPSGPISRGGRSPLRLVLDTVRLVPMRSDFTARLLWGWNGLDLPSGISLIHLVPLGLWICIYVYNMFNIDKYNLSYAYLLLQHQ